jgi:hypothetical protein
LHFSFFFFFIQYRRQFRTKIYYKLVWRNIVQPYLYKYDVSFFMWEAYTFSNCKNKVRINFRVKYPIGTWVFICFISDTWVRGKNPFDTYVTFFVKILTVCHVSTADKIIQFKKYLYPPQITTQLSMYPPNY